MKYESLCKKCIYGQFISGDFIHSEDYYTTATDPDEDEPWKQSLREDTKKEKKELKMCVSFCFFPIDLTKLQSGQNPTGKEFHDIIVKECNQYKHKYDV